KGTVAARLEGELELEHVSSGQLFRQEVEKDSPIGRRAKSFLENGELVPDDTVLELMESWLTNGRLNGGFMLDGFPRNLAQAKALDAWLMEQGKPLEAVIFFDGPESVMVERITGRRVCPQCGRNYHEQDMRPKV